MMIVVPEKIPAEPIPAMARPTMKAWEFGAPPQRADPTSNMVIAMRNIVFVE
jgi:hypothetical protein